MTERKCNCPHEHPPERDPDNLPPLVVMLAVAVIILVLSLIVLANTASAAEPETTTATCADWRPAYLGARANAADALALAEAEAVEIDALRATVAERDRRILDLTRSLVVSPPPAPESSRVLQAAIIVGGAALFGAAGGGACALAECDLPRGAGVSGASAMAGGALALLVLWGLGL